MRRCGPVRKVILLFVLSCTDGIVPGAIHGHVSTGSRAASSDSEARFSASWF